MTALDVLVTLALLSVTAALLVAVRPRRRAEPERISRRALDRLNAELPPEQIG